MFMPLARLAQYQHCLLRRNGTRTQWSACVDADSKETLGERMASLRAQWINNKVDADGTDI